MQRRRLLHCRHGPPHAPVELGVAFGVARAVVGLLQDVVGRYLATRLHADRHVLPSLRAEAQARRARVAVGQALMRRGGAYAGAGEWRRVELSAGSTVAGVPLAARWPRRALPKRSRGARTPRQSLETTPPAPAGWKPSEASSKASPWGRRRGRTGLRGALGSDQKQTCAMGC